MTFPLKLGASGALAQFVAADNLQTDQINPITFSGDLAVGDNMGAGDTLELGSTTALVRVMGDGQVDGQLTVAETVTFGDPESQTTSGATLTIDLTANQKHRITLASNITTVSITDPPGAGNFVLEFVQNGTGSFTVTGWPANVLWPSNVEPTFGDGANEVRLVSLYYNGPTADDYFGDYRPQIYN